MGQSQEDATRTIVGRVKHFQCLARFVDSFLQGKYRDPVEARFCAEFESVKNYVFGSIAHVLS